MQRCSEDDVWMWLELGWSKYDMLHSEIVVDGWLALLDKISAVSVTQQSLSYPKDVIPNQSPIRNIDITSCYFACADTISRLFDRLQQGFEAPHRHRTSIFSLGRSKSRCLSVSTAQSSHYPSTDRGRNNQSTPNSTFLCYRE